VPELALDDVERDAFARKLQRVRVRQLVRREATPDARLSGEPAELGEAWGLLLAGFEEGLPPILRRAGQQYLALRGAVDPCVLRFLPREVDDLYARRVLFTMRTTGKGSGIPLERRTRSSFASTMGALPESTTTTICIRRGSSTGFRSSLEIWNGVT
jgi:hypothetical protein